MTATGTTEVRGQVYAWSQAGAGGQRVLLLHGWQNAGSTWQPLVDRLRGTGMTLTAVDLPGCGHSPPPDAWQRATIDEMAADVVALSDRLGIEHPVVIGHSIGGAIGIAAALAAPAAVAGLVLIAPASTSGLDFVSDDQFQVLLDPTPEQRRALAEAAFHRPLPATDLAAVVQLVESADPRHVEAGARSMRDFVVQQRLADLRMPTLVIAGDRDRHVPLRNHLDTWRAIPLCGLHVFHGVGHVPFWEAADACAEVVASFIGSEVPWPATTS